MSKHRIGWILATVGLATAVALLPRGNVQQIAAFVLLWLLPVPLVTAVLNKWLQPLPPENEEIWLMAAGLVLLTQPLLALLIHYLPGPIFPWLLFLLVVLLPIICTFAPLSLRWPRHTAAVLLILLLALLLRLPNMGYKEIQGDEGVILVRAAAALTGDDAELFLHQKGPMEILLPLLPWGLTGALTDFWARLPFLWAGVLGVAALMLLARRWFNGRTALIAGALFAIMGFSIAFSRIIQYQSLVMLWGVLALLAAARYRDTARPLALYLTAVFLAGALLAHYDAVLWLPAIIWQVAGGEWRMASQKAGLWARAGLLGVGILALFYVPFALNPNFNRTVSYLLNDRVGAADGLTSWPGAAVWQMMTFYNSTYYIVGLIGLLVIGLWVLARRRAGGTAVLAFLVPAIFYIFLVNDPRTHVYMLFPGAIILAAVGADAISEWLRQNQLAYGAGLAVGLLWFGVSAVYVYLLFVDVTPERQRTWAENRPSFYSTTWDEPPRYGLFGFPHQAGWRVVPELLDADFGVYASNEEEEITNWYMGQAPRIHCPQFDKFIWVAQAQDEIAYDSSWLQHLQAEVLVNGRVTLQIYGREEGGGVTRVEVDGRQRWLTPAAVAPPTYSGTHSVDVVLGEQVRLLGYDMDSSQAYPGGQLQVTLYWQPLVPLTRNYQVFTHLYDGQMRGQHDGAPECALNPTTRWEPGQIIADPHLMEIAGDAEPGIVPLSVGMYDLLDQQRLTVPGSADNSLYLTDVILVAEPPDQ